MTWWESPEWRQYERLCGDAPGTRARLLASADWLTRVVDLSLSEAELWRGVRKSYKGLIRAAERVYTIQSISGACIYSAMKIHEQEAGRMTRPIETWGLQGGWVVDGHAILVSAGRRQLMDITMCQDTESRLVPFGLLQMRGFVYCVTFGRWAYYFSGATSAKNLNHALIWHAMKALKARGVRWFELGWMAREGDTEKDRQISFLKRGFGGVDIPAREAPALCESGRPVH